MSVNKGLDGSGDLASCTIDDAGVIRWAAAPLAALLGVANPIGRTLDEALEGWERLPGAGPAALTKGDGDERRVLEMYANPIGEAETQVAFFDVTHHRSIERELSELAQFPEKNPGPVLWLDREATVLRSNVAAKRVFGDDIVGACWLDRCPGMTDEIWQQARAATQPFVHDADFEHGCYAMSHVAADDGAFVFTFGADITDRRKAEKQLAEVARFPDMNPGPVLRLSLDGAVLLANRAARDLFGDEIAGASWKTVFPESVPRWDELLRSPVPVPIETRVGDRDYQFTHRFDKATDLLFVFGADITEQKRAERGIQHAERMATLGTLAAGVAHELNNPAAAVRRAADQLRDAFARQQQAQLALDAAAIDEQARARIRAIAEETRAHAERPNDLDTVTRSDREAEVEDWLDDHDIDDEWDLAPMLVEQGLDAAALDALVDGVAEDAQGAVVMWVAATFPVYRLAHEIGQASGRISEIVGAMKSYSYLGQAPRQDIDLHEGIDNTLVILRNKLKVGVVVERNYCDDMPPVPAFGSELNQVWTNLLDNAVDAMNGKGSITITTWVEEGHAHIRICDDGPGMTAETAAHVFDPFFTTKEPGKGTGLGLATTYSIVKEKHGGTVTVTSEPGETCFTVRLPIATKEH